MIVIVNDGSNDNTVKEVKKKMVENEAERKASIVLLSHPVNRGGGAANKTGITFLQQNHEEL